MTILSAFLFDLDGTLAHTLPDIAASTNYVRGLHRLPHLTEDGVRQLIGDGARNLLRRALADALPPDDAGGAAAIDAAMQQYTAHHREQCTVDSELFPGVAEHLDALRSQGHAIAVVTNKPERFALPVVEHLGLRAWTDVVVGGDTLPQRKPDPAPLKHALTQLGRPATAATMIGDGLQDVRAGKALGMRTIACLFGYGDPELLRREGADLYWRAFATPA